MIVTLEEHFTLGDEAALGRVAQEVQCFLDAVPLEGFSAPHRPSQLEQLVKVNERVLVVENAGVPVQSSADRQVGVE